MIKPNRKFLIPFLETLHPTKFPELFFDGISLEGEKVTKILVVFVDENGIWKIRINTVSTKISKSIRILYGARLMIP